MTEHDLVLRLQWREHELASEDDFTVWLTAGLQQLSSEQQSYSLSLSVVDAAQSQALNLRFRKKDKPTNVLAFPAPVVPAMPGEAQPLGDIVLCGPLVLEEAKTQGKMPRSHACHLCLHGLLHLLGFDHQAEAEALEMEAEERRILADFGIPDPYNRV